jgi:CubicO group peptidase (beta-lactamase class C family)
MRRFVVLLLACYGAAFPAGPILARPEAAGLSSDRLKRLSAAMQGYIDRGEVAGVVTLVARRGQVVHLESQGVMDVDSKAPMKRDTIVRLASMTKPITSVAVMMLAEEGRFQLTDPVSKFIPEFKNPKVVMANFPGSSREGTRVVPADREITIQDLLTHSAGLATNTAILLQAEWEKFQKEGTPGEDIGGYTRRLAKLPLNFQPGTAWEYGPATNVLGYLVEVVSGQRFDRFLAERIFRPLEMNDTFFYVPDDKLGRLATVHERVIPKGIRVSRAAREMRGSQVFFAGAGGLFSTVDDYWRFCQMLLNGGSFNGARLLGRKTVELMTANQIANLPLWPDLAGYRFGLGFRVLADVGKSAQPGSLGSYGWGGAFGTYFFIDPKEEMIGILLIQMRSWNHLNIRPDLVSLAEQAIMD